MKETTYIFGAGASYNSMPLVEDFPDRFSFFIDFLNSPTAREPRKKFSERCQDFLTKVKSHSSFDTYFKKLFHLNKEDEIKIGKVILLTYFIFEHYYKVDQNSRSDKRINRKNSTIDNRYEALIAGLLKPIKGKSEFYQRINFITWNYDLNLLYSLKNFFFKGEPLNEAVEISKNSKNIIKVNPQLEIVHLNGLIHNSRTDDITEIETAELDRIINYMVDSIYRSNEEQFISASYINFAWEAMNTESDNNVPGFIKLAKDFIDRSENIVLIGYSFPLYNRLIDFYLLNQNALKGKKVIIQDPNAEGIRDILRSDFSILEQTPVNTQSYDRDRLTDIKIIKAVNSFFIPNNIFTNNALGNI